MQKRNVYWLIAGGICLFSTLLHLIAGQSDLVDPLLESELSGRVRVELLGVWHMATVALVFGTFVLLRGGLRPSSSRSAALGSLGGLFVGFALAFILASGLRGLHAPQWILLLPIGILALLGSKRFVNAGRKEMK